ncbi:hemocytin [Phlebotomus argentipes]|uniref:hemocytin n=1 Tax=Phlebotomus argentipes TaxID=94469 RepID=UPI0028933CAB|nr:hemocytin [Phlebotomus argentipes]
MNSQRFVGILLLAVFGCISVVADQDPEAPPQDAQPVGDPAMRFGPELELIRDQIPIQLDQLVKDTFTGSTEEAPQIQNDAHAVKNLMENMIDMKKSMFLGHEKHGMHPGLHHGMHHGGGYSYQVKGKFPYGHQHHHQWTHEGASFPTGLVNPMQGCAGQPNQPLNAVLKCTSNSNTCKATCMPDYKFPNGETSLLISCVEGEWIVQGAEWPQVPSCEPICSPQCLNNGICVSPGICTCPDNFRGPQCQYEKKMCLQKPSLPSNSRQTCTSSQCTISCAKGYRFPDGTTVSNVVCRDGEWKPTRGDWSTVPDCQPVCIPRCRNGGNCLSFNVCQCPPEFRGPQCQYSVENCAPKKLKFNGGYNCSGTGDTITCTLYCPQGVEFDQQPAPQYTCSYASGVFSPSFVPKCIFSSDMDVVSMGGYSQSTQIRTGQTLHGGGWSYSHGGGGGGGYQEIEITKTRKYKDGDKYYVDGGGEEFEVIQLPGVYNLYISNEVGIVYRQPKPSICMTWNGNKVKTFDGLIYSSPLFCAHTLIHDQVDGSFSVIVRSCPMGSPQPCSHSLVVFLLNMMYTFENVNGSVRFSSPKSVLPIPSQLTGMKVTMIGHRVKIVLESVQTSILWDTDKLVVVEASPSLWNRTGGLCGTMDMDVRNDFISKTGAQQKLARTFVDSWRTPNVDIDKSKCIMGSVEDMDTAKCDAEKKAKAKIICENLVKSSKFIECLEKYNSEMLIQSCISDYCFCPDTEHPEKCSCDGISVFAQDCAFQGVELEHGWRDMELCPLPCPDGRIYRACGPSSEPSCGVAVTNEKDSHCREGCFCPEGTIQHEGKCIDPFQCPCQLRGKSFKPGSKVKKDCNTCTCDNGSWKCTDVSCGSRCGAIGDPHYVTFDGRRFDFMGKCSYRLLLTENVTVDAENVACPGSISEAMELIPTSLDLPSCTKSVTISYKIGDKLRSIKLKQGRTVFVDDQEVIKLPKTLVQGLLKIRQASSTFLSVEFQDGLKVWWDGITRVYIDTPATYRDKTKGLCGTFNSNQQDDFLTPEGDIESVVEPFADKWRTKETCPYVTDTVPVPHPCQVNLENKSKAEKMCGKLKAKVFEDCHWYVDYMPFYEDCLYDVCACKGDDVNACLCPILSSYAAECARQGVVINWRLSVTECGVKCPPGQVFEECGDSCSLTCEDLQGDYPCRKHCVEGCRCPDGQALNEDNECVPIGMCPCAYKGLTFRPGYKEVRPGSKFLELCTCSSAKWDCAEANDEDATKYPPAADIRSKCLASNNEEFTTCEPPEPVTCKNMHTIQESSPMECVAGCVCKKGFVLDMATKKCVRPKDCSCHHGGVSYKDGDEITELCNKCECEGGTWKCTDHQCPGICTSWGDSHFTTYDGKDFDFQGVCNYVLSKGSLGADGGFSVTIQNVLCGSLGETCSKSVHISILGSNSESLTLSADSPIPGMKDTSVAQKGKQSPPLKSLLVYRAGIFIVVEAPEMGLQVKWDRGTRVYITLSNQWRGKVQGLCGNFNNDLQDDFKTPSAGVETNPIIFGDSWKLQDYCPKTTEQVDSCAKHPHRTMWAQRKCGILKSGVFQACHAEVPVENFLKRCTHDTCACDQGGDCECLCTALAAYAHACTLKGVSIRWRTPDLCPMQCDPECSSYSPCISSCPVETCDNVITTSKDKWMCSEDSCVEGCKLKGCPAGHIYSNETFSDCVPKSICKPLCMEINGVSYYEGDILSSDLCQTCRCSRNKKICSGAPCAEGVTTVDHMFVTRKPDQDEDLKCVSGWSEWINQDVSATLGVKTVKKGKKIGEKEPIPNYLLMKNVIGATCSPDKISKIECRTVGDHKSVKSTGENCECSLERGLVCEGSCSDYEIRVLCDCDGTYVEQKTLAPIASVPVTVCDPSIPHVEYPGDCFKFRHCMPMPDGSWQYAEKTCGPTMMFNPKTMICDWVFSVMEIKPECGKPGKPKEDIKIKVDKCPPGEAWTDCVIPCANSCHYYVWVLKKNGFCSNMWDELVGCAGGCVDASQLEIPCPAPGLWRDKSSCVQRNQCTCASKSGTLVKPGEVFRESDCELCQCIDNAYVCDTSTCTRQKVEYTVAVEDKTEHPPVIFTRPVTTERPLIIQTTVSPPPVCDLTKYQLIPVLSGEDTHMPDSAFSASSVLGSFFEAHFARINSKPSEICSGSWSPATNDDSQYLQITFPQQMPLYGVQISGSPLYNHYVKLFKILYSHDGVAFSCLKDGTAEDQLFYGPVESSAMTQSLFSIPIEAKVVRIYPLKWHEAIAIRIELLGCGKVLTTTTPKPTTEATTKKSTPIPIKLTTSITEELVQPICDDPMGVENGKMSPPQIKFSSSKADHLVLRKPPSAIEQLKLSSPQGWLPNVDTPNEFVIFDFLEKRNLTGLKVKGGDYGWVTAFRVYYSQDEVLWNLIQGPDGSGKLFGGCIDSQIVKVNMFKYPIQARYLKIVPEKWQEKIEMKIEPLGCFQPYPHVEQEKKIEEVKSVPKIKCGICAGVLPPLTGVVGVCNCYPPQVWNGQECVQPSQCPCMVGHIPYEVGAHFELEDCSECVCVLGGNSQCQQKVCPACEKGLRPVKSPNCQCSCETCPQSTILCPTSGECIAEHLWCNGVMDCPDDEINCKPKGPTIETVLNITKTCPAPHCLPGYRVKVIEKKPVESAMFTHKTKGRWRKKPSKYSKFNFHKNRYNSHLATPSSSPSIVDEPEKCIEFICVPEKMLVPKNDTIVAVKCVKPQCPEGYNLVSEKPIPPSICPVFDCEPQPQRDAVCNVTGRNFNTFDGMEFKFDICSHVLAREFSGGNWTITLLKNCSAGDFLCTKEVEITDTELECIVTLYPDLTVKYNGYIYTVDQLQKGKDKMNFAVSKVGATIVFVSHNHGFWVTLDEYGDIKIGVSQKYSSQVDGLCGFFNGQMRDDKRLPNGDDAQSTVEFGEAWYVDRMSKENCQPHACPRDIQEEAWRICNAVGETFSVCEKSMDIEKFTSKCIETACECLRSSKSSETSGKSPAHRCKCSILQGFVRECLAADDKVHLDTWRSTYDCELPCPPSLVHRDCYRRRCELSCDTLKSEDCPYLPGTCFSGCYCPEGTVRKGDKCVNPTQECLDCVCDGFGQSQYVTYDRSNFTFDGNCTYLLTRDLIFPGLHTFEVFVNLGRCKGGSTCTEALHVLHNDNILHLQRKKGTAEIEIFVNGAQVRQLPYAKEWVKVTEEPGKLIRVLLPLSFLELTTTFEDMSFSLRVPSLKYGGKLEGLCGDCDGEDENDLVMNKEVAVVENPTVQDIVMSWQSRNPALNLPDDECVSEERKEVECAQHDADPCMKLLELDVFAQCHLVVDPIMYVSACQKDLCRNEKGSCESLAAYARECAQNGICIDWRKPDFCPHDCPQPLEYQACGCRDSCESFLKKEQQHVLLDVCTVNREEGCFCGEGKLLHNGVCIVPKMCQACDDDHFAGDVWFKDKCNRCECFADGKIICTKTECPADDVVCRRGFRAIEMPTVDSCCKKFVCVPEEVQPKEECPLTALPKCGQDQVKKIEYDSNNCTKIICECKPASDCPPPEVFPAQLLPGFKVFEDTSGCCPTARLECDKSLCPPPITQCSEEFFEVVKTEAKSDECCDSFKCTEPKGVCIVQENGKNSIKKIGDKWKSSDPCLLLVCTVSLSGSVIVSAEKEICEDDCKMGFKYAAPTMGSDKCCGECVQSHCKDVTGFFEIGSTWRSSDNCTTFRCEMKDGQFYIVSEQESCPDVHDCPQEKRYTKGCCVFCQPEISDQKKCIPEVHSESDTVGLVTQSTPDHGQCTNLTPLPLLDVLLTCTDGHKISKKVPIPQTCNCSQCPGFVKH